MNQCGRLAAALGMIALAVPAGSTRATAGEDAGLAARGHDLVVTSGCNDCHTPMYAEQAGNVPEAAWLTGSPLGWRGPWGTSYPINLRLLVNGTDEAQWLHQLRTVQARPPMPWYDVRRMSDADLLAIYAFIRSLGPAGTEAPSALPPGVSPPPPFFELVLPPPGR